MQVSVLNWTDNLCEVDESHLLTKTWFGAFRCILIYEHLHLSFLAVIRHIKDFDIIETLHQVKCSHEALSVLV